MAPRQCWRQAARLLAPSEHHETLGEAQGLLSGEDTQPNACCSPPSSPPSRGDDPARRWRHRDCREQSGMVRREGESEKLDEEKLFAQDQPLLHPQAPKIHMSH